MVGWSSPMQFTHYKPALFENVIALFEGSFSTPHQKQGIGQGLIRFGLDQLRCKGIALVVTYGDPAFYSRFGFEPVSQQQIEAPYTLSHPEGWQAASLTAGPIPSIPGGTQCVPAFRHPVYW